MIDFEKRKNRLLLIYEAEFGSNEWVGNELKERGRVTIARTFHLETDNLVEDSERDRDAEELEGTEEAYKFAIGTLRKGYFKIAGDTLGITHDVYLAEHLPINKDTFVAHRNISIFKKFDRVTSEDIYIGGTNPKALPAAEFEKLLASFPNSTELDRYASAKVARVLSDYFETTTDAEKKLEDYVSKRKRKARPRGLSGVYELEAAKYEFIRDRIIELLADESSFSENEWRDLMVEFILLILPKYICVLRNVRIRDFYTSPGTPRSRFIDLALVDANGNLDVIEIKKPFENCLVSGSNYRDNFTPHKELSGTIMQAEKYLFHLSKWGIEGETEISKKQRANLPAGLTVRITNPKALVIAGRSKALTKPQQFDFEVIKRKYANIMDILSYDDLLDRLSSIIAKFKRVS
jgi:hypothetical protein